VGGKGEMKKKKEGDKRWKDLSKLIKLREWRMQTDGWGVWLG
jgi:hypothetical protein